METNKLLKMLNAEDRKRSDYENRAWMGAGERLALETLIGLALRDTHNETTLEHLRMAHNQLVPCYHARGLVFALSDAYSSSQDPTILAAWELMLPIYERCR